MRPAFGGKALWKVSVNTKSAAEANILFLQPNAALEQQFEEIRVRIKATGEPLPSQRDRASDMIAAYFQGPERDAGGLVGTERLLLARLEIDRGLWNMTPTECSPVAASSIDQCPLLGIGGHLGSWFERIGHHALPVTMFKTPRFWKISMWAQRWILPGQADDMLGLLCGYFSDQSFLRRVHRYKAPAKRRSLKGIPKKNSVAELYGSYRLASQAGTCAQYLGKVRAIDDAIFTASAVVMALGEIVTLSEAYP
jgi:hypothetical protein